MEQHTSPRDSSTHIIAKIQEAHIRMRPKWYFVLQAALSIAGMALIFLMALYLISFVSFIIKESHMYVAPQFGMRGLYIFLISLPWLLIGFAFLFMIILEILVKKYSFAYRRPLLYSLFGLVCVVLAGSVIVNRAGFHLQMLHYADRKELPLAGPLYRSYGRPDFRQMYVGQITRFTDTGCAMRDSRGSMVSVTITPKTRMPKYMQLMVNDHILVIGDRDDDVIHAFGIRKIPPPRW